MQSCASRNLPAFNVSMLRWESGPFSMGTWGSIQCFSTHSTKAEVTYGFMDRKCMIGESSCGEGHNVLNPCLVTQDVVDFRVFNLHVLVLVFLRSCRSYGVKTSQDAKTLSLYMAWKAQLPRHILDIRFVSQLTLLPRHNVPGTWGFP